MINENDILKRILLNMKYDSSMTLNENYDLLVEQKKPSIEVGDVTQTIEPNVPDQIKNGKVNTTIDYKGKSMTFFGYIDKTIQQKINEWLGEIGRLQESSYRESPNYVNVVEYVGPEWGNDLYKSYQQNKIKFDELKQRVGGDSLKYTQKVVGYKYKNNTIGYIAERCRTSLQSELKKEAKGQNLVRFENKEWYAEPTNVLTCVEDSVKTMFNELSKTGLFSFWSTNPNTNEKEFYYLSFSCNSSVVDDTKTFYNRQFNPNAPEIKVKIPTRCAPSTMVISGYKTTAGKKWDDVKLENKKIVDRIKSETQGNTNNTTSKDEKGSMTGLKTGVVGGEEGSEGELTLDLSL